MTEIGLGMTEIIDQAGESHATLDDSETTLPIELIIHLLDFLAARELIALLPLSSLLYSLSYSILKKRIAALLLKSELLVRLAYTLDGIWTDSLRSWNQQVRPNIPTHNDRSSPSLPSLPSSPPSPPPSPSTSLPPNGKYIPSLSTLTNSSKRSSSPSISNRNLSPYHPTPSRDHMRIDHGVDSILDSRTRFHWARDWREFIGDGSKNPPWDFPPSPISLVEPPPRSSIPLLPAPPLGRKLLSPSSKLRSNVFSSVRPLGRNNSNNYARRRDRSGRSKDANWAKRR